MPPVVQSTSAVADNPTNFGLSFSEQVTAGNLLLCAVQANGKAVTAVTDTAGNNWTLAVGTNSGSAGFFASIWFAVAKANASGLKVSPTIATPQEDVHIHLYEIFGYDSLDQTGGNAVSQTSNPFSISTSGATKRSAEFIIALFNDLENSGEGGPAQTWTGQAGNEGTQTTSDSAYYTSMFTEVFEVTTAGIQTATASSATYPESDEQLIATFYSSRAGGYWSQKLINQPARYTPPRPAIMEKPIYNAARLRRR